MAKLEIDINYTGVYARDRHYRNIFLPVDESEEFNLVYRFKLTGAAIVTVILIVEDSNGNIVRTITQTEDWSHLQEDWVYTYNSKNFGKWNLSKLGGNDLYLTWQFYLNGQLHTEYKHLVHIINASKILDLGYIKIKNIGWWVYRLNKYADITQRIPICGDNNPPERDLIICIESKLPDMPDRNFRIKVKYGTQGFMKDVTQSVIHPGANTLKGYFPKSNLVVNESKKLDTYIEFWFYYDYHSDNHIRLYSKYVPQMFEMNDCSAYSSTIPKCQANISILSINISKQTLNVGEFFSLNVTVKNSGSVGSYITIKIPLLGIEHKEYLNAGQSKTIDFGKNFAFHKSGTYNLCVNIGNIQKCITVTVNPSEPQLEIEDMFVDSESGIAGSTVNFTVSIINKGGSTGTKTLVVSVNGSEIKRETITLAPLNKTVKVYNIPVPNTKKMYLCAKLV